MCVCCVLQALVSAAMRYRVLLSHHVLAVSPLLELSPAVSPSAADLSCYTLKLEATYSKVGWGRGTGHSDAGQGCVAATASVGASEAQPSHKLQLASQPASFWPQQ